MQASISGLPEMENWLSPIKEELRELRRSLDQNDAEIDTLQLEAQKARGPWYRDISVMVSISAVLFSMLTTAFSYYIARQQDIHNSKAELRGLIQGITELNREYADLISASNSTNQAYHLSAVTAEIILLTNQADDLIEQIPSYVTPVEYFSVADAFARNGYPERAEELYLEAIDASRTRSDKVASLRAYAQLLILSQKHDEVRNTFAAALSTNQEFSSNYPLVVLRDDMYTHLSWANYELSQRQCAKAREQLGKASSIASQLFLPAADPFTVQLNLLLKAAESCVES